MAHFNASQFGATNFTTAEAKAGAANALASFVECGFEERRFTKAVYNALYLHLFGHIAHYNRNGFYGEWFSTVEDRIRWCQRVLDWVPYGEPEHTWVDVERAFKKWLKNRNIPIQLRERAENDALYDSVYSIAAATLKYAQPLTPGTVSQHVNEAKCTVHDKARKEMDPHRCKAIEERLVREQVQTSKRFQCAAISSNTNAFGHSRYIFVALDRECWQMTAWQQGQPIQQGDSVDVALVSGRPQWGSLGFEVPQQRENCLAHVLAE
jgi:hypothetical protein